MNHNSLFTVHTFLDPNTSQELIPTRSLLTMENLDHYSEQTNQFIPVEEWPQDVQDRYHGLVLLPPHQVQGSPELSPFYTVPYSVITSNAWYQWVRDGVVPGQSRGTLIPFNYDMPGCEWTQESRTLKGPDVLTTQLGMHMYFQYSPHKFQSHIPDLPTGPDPGTLLFFGSRFTGLISVITSQEVVLLYRLTGMPIHKQPVIPTEQLFRDQHEPLLLE